MDAIGWVEQAYRVELSTAAWLDALARGAKEYFDDGMGTLAMCYDASDPERPRMLDVCSIDTARDQRQVLPAMFAAHGPTLVHTSLRFSGCTSMRRRFVELFGERETAGHVERLFEYCGGARPADFLQVSAFEPDGSGVMFGAFRRTSRPPPRRELRRWQRLVAHLHSAVRLRRSLGGAGAIDATSAEAVVEAGGRVQHATGPARQALGSLREAAWAIDRARGRRSDPDERLDLWPALVSGRWSLLEHFERDGRRYFVAVENEPACRDPRALTERERQVVHFAAFGHSDKWIAYALGLSASRVASHLASARRKLGLRSRVELVRFLRELGGAGPRGAPREPRGAAV
ncbi:LuxR C-terminal-related transcriptional regulator [Sorangium sp. So ce119]|uniref:helix-turn-helix transcriptional regulator n=1 Tax=Sorangium sp. So ce119 TaxID=3133279 RepID=UPI003F5DF76B